jgi:hypothetical protein
LAEQLDETRLKALIAEEISLAENFAQSELTPDRERAINYYNGTVPDVPAVEGRSQYISRDVSNVVGWMLPDLMRIFTASDRVLDCIPETQKDEETAEQAADYINYVFWQDNPGYQIMRDAEWDALVNKDGIIKQFWEVKQDCKYSTYTGLDADQVAVILDEEGVELVEQSKPYTALTPVEVEVPPPQQPQQPPMVDLQSPDLPPQTGAEDQQQAPQPDMMEGQEPQPEAAPEPPETVIQMQPVELFDIKIKRVVNKGRLTYQTVAPEDFITDSNAIDLVENWRFQAERAKNVTRSDLIKMGFDRDRIDAIPAFQSQDTSTEDLARRHLVTGQYDNPERSMERVNLYECYVKMDINDDGMAEIVKVMYAGDSGGAEILDWEEWDDETPYDKIPCNPVPHRFASDSVADEVMDVMKFKTVIGRQLFDNLYMTNTPQPIYDSGSILNPDAVANPGIGVPIIKKAGTAPMQWNITPFIGDKALMAMNYLDDVIEMRTGVSRSSMSLDPEVLQNQTAAAVNATQSNSHAQVELIARDQAELGWKRVFQKSLKITVKNQDRPRTIRLRDKWVDMDPRQWNANMDIVINIGLGTGSRDRDMAMLTNILATQQADMQQLQAAGFVEDAIDMIPKIIKTQVKIAEAAGIKSPETFYPEIPTERLEQMKQQAKAAQGQPSPADQAAKDKLDAEMQMKQADMQLRAQQSQADNAMKQQQMQQDTQVKQQQLAAEIQLKREQLQAELQLKREQMAAELQLQRETAAWNAHATASRPIVSSDVHIGGQPG